MIWKNECDDDDKMIWWWWWYNDEITLAVRFVPSGKRTICFPPSSLVLIQKLFCNIFCNFILIFNTFLQRRHLHHHWSKASWLPAEVVEHFVKPWWVWSPITSQIYKPSHKKNDQLDLITMVSSTVPLSVVLVVMMMMRMILMIKSATHCWLSWTCM